MKLHIQLSRYAMVGFVSNVVGYLLFILLSRTGVGHKTAMSLVYAIGVVQTFYFNRTWSFSHQGGFYGTFLRYIIAYVLGYLLNLALLWLAVDRLHIPYQGVQAAAIVMVAVSLFLMHKYWVFPQTTAGTDTV